MLRIRTAWKASARLLVLALVATALLAISPPRAQASVGVRFLNPVNGSVAANDWIGPVRVRVAFAGADVGRHFVLYYPNGDYDQFTIRPTWSSPHVVQGMSWPVGRLGPGRYTVKVNRDEPGDRRTVASSSFTVKRWSLTDVAARPAKIYSTIQDGYLDCTTIAWRQNIPGTARLSIIGKGSLPPVRAVAGLNHYRWCGQRPGGGRVAAGVYRVQMIAADIYGRTGYTPRVTVTVATGTRIVQKTRSVHGDAAAGVLIWDKPCAAAKHVFTSTDAAIRCEKGKGALAYKFQIPATTVRWTAQFHARATRESGRIFTGHFYKGSTVVVVYIGVDGTRTLEVTGVDFAYKYGVKI